MICGKYIAVHFTSFVLLTKLCHGIVTTRIIPPSPLKRLIFTSTKSARGTECSMSDWDAENGVWLGDRATSDNQLPSPLYLFGYGSLLWRPGELLGNFTSSSCSCSGWQRLFSQRSSDHRGSTDFPGFVATLVEATYLKEKLQELSQIKEAFDRGIDERIETIGDAKISCSGLVWLIPEDRIKGTIAELDYRERGGYHRHIVRVTLKQDTELHSAGTVVDALVYSGSTSNPNFHFMPRGCRFDSQEIETDTETATVTKSHCATADIIAAAVGPSGSNSDYLFNLNDYLHENGISDGYIQELSAAVALRMGPWRERPYVRYLKHTAKSQSSAKDLFSSSAKVSSPSPVPLSLPALAPPPAAPALALAATMPPPPPCLLNTPSKSIIDTEFQGKKIHHLKTFLDSEYLTGWGSNEHLQLGVRTPMTHPTLFLQSASSPVHLNIEKKKSRTLSDSSTKLLDPSTVVPNLLQPSPDDDEMLQENSSKIRYKNDINEEISFCQVLCGGASSAFLGPFGDLTIWGKILKLDENNKSTVVSSITANLNTENDIEEDNVKHKSGLIGKEGSSASEFLLEEQDRRLIFKDIVGAALGHGHILLLTKKGWVVPIGDNDWGQCQGPKAFFPQGILNFKSFSSSSGSSSSNSSSGGAGSSSQDMRTQYSSLANGNKEGYSYSDNNNSDDENSIDLQQRHLLDEEPEVQVLKLACGVRHSAAITKQGDLHVWGSGSAACIVLPTHPATKTNENSSTSNKESVKEDLEQLQFESFQSPTWRPDDAKLIDVSCGMELTVTIDDKGRVWSFGSNKHGSLGRTFPANLDENLSSLKDKNPCNIVQVQVDSSSQKNEKSKTRNKIEKDSTPRLVEGLESGVRWQRVVCGWSHTIIRGVRVDGSVACAAWGRRNLGQYPVEDSTREEVKCDMEKKSKEDSSKTVRDSEDMNDLGMEGPGSVKPTHSPQRLVLPHGLIVREVWAGSEYTVVADQAGYLWASGWNEHGNLGRGTGGLAFASSDGWLKVMHSDKSLVSSSVNGELLTGDSREHREGVAEADLHVRLSVVWEGAVSCGGGHVLALTKSKSTK